MHPHPSPASSRRPILTTVLASSRKKSRAPLDKFTVMGVPGMPAASLLCASPGVPFPFGVEYQADHNAIRPSGLEAHEVRCSPLWLRTAEMGRVAATIIVDPVAGWQVVVRKRGIPLSPLRHTEELDQFRQCGAYLGRAPDAIDKLRVSRCPRVSQHYIVPILYHDESSDNELGLFESVHPWPRLEIAIVLEIGFRQLTAKLIRLHIMPHNGPWAPPKSAAHVPVKEEDKRGQEAA